jgi:hypothetical protein
MPNTIVYNHNICNIYTDTGKILKLRVNFR